MAPWKKSLCLEDAFVMQTLMIPTAAKSSPFPPWAKIQQDFCWCCMKQPFHKKKTDSSEDVPWIPVTHRPGSPLPNASLAVILPACLPALFTTIMFNPPLNHNAAGQSSKCPTPAPITYGVAPGCPGHQDWISQLISVWGPDCHTVTWFPFGWGLGCSFYPDSGALQCVGDAERAEQCDDGQHVFF